MITLDDVLLYFPTFLEVVLFAFLVSRLITFIPSLMLSFVRKIKNPSIIYNEPTSLDPTIDKGNLDPTIDKGELGLKNLMDRWF